MIIVNKGNQRIMITTQWHADSLGGSAVSDIAISFMPEEKINLSILDAEPLPIDWKKIWDKYDEVCREEDNVNVHHYELIQELVGRALKGEL